MFNLGDVNSLLHNFSDFVVIFRQNKCFPVFSGIYVVFMSNMNYYYYVLE